MAGRAGSGGGGTGLPWASVFDPIANARALGDVQAQGLRAAGELVERLARSVDGTVTRTARSDDGETAPDGASPLSGDAARLLEVWIELLQRASTSFASATGSRAPTDERVEVDLDAGSVTGVLRLEVDGSGAIRAGTAEAWLHNGTAAPVGPLTLHSGDLRSPDGDLLVGTLAFDPAYLDALPGRSSRGVALSIAKEGELRPGMYRGLMQVKGAPQVWLPVEVVVGGPA